MRYLKINTLKSIRGKHEQILKWSWSKETKPEATKENNLTFLCRETFYHIQSLKKKLAEKHFQYILKTELIISTLQNK